MEGYESILEAEQAWEDYCKENNIENTLKNNDRQAYNIYKDQKDIWIGQYLLENYGCDELIFFAQVHSGGQSGPPSPFVQWISKQNLKEI